MKKVDLKLSDMFFIGFLVTLPSNFYAAIFYFVFSIILGLIDAILEK